MELRLFEWGGARYYYYDGPACVAIVFLRGDIVSELSVVPGAREGIGSWILRELLAQGARVAVGSTPGMRALLVKNGWRATGRRDPVGYEFFDAPSGPA